MGQSGSTNETSKRVTCPECGDTLSIPLGKTRRCQCGVEITNAGDNDIPDGEYAGLPIAPTWDGLTMEQYHALVPKNGVGEQWPDWKLDDCPNCKRKMTRWFEPTFMNAFKCPHCDAYGTAQTGHVDFRDFRLPNEAYTFTGDYPDPIIVSPDRMQRIGVWEGDMFKPNDPISHGHEMPDYRFLPLIPLQPVDIDPDPETVWRTANEHFQRNPDFVKALAALNAYFSGDTE